MSDEEVRESGDHRESLLDEIIEKWEELNSQGSDVSVEALCENDEQIRESIKSFPGLLEQAEEEVCKLRRFDKSFGDLIEEGDPRAQGIDHRVEGDETIAGPRDGAIPLGNQFLPMQPLVPSDDEDNEDSKASSDGKSAKRVHPGTRLIVDSPLTVESRFDGGGLGDIYRASDDSLRRPVAVKLIRNYSQNRHYTRRFLREATVTAQLNGPGVIPIYGYGTAGDGQPFYVMRLIEGDGLDEKIKTFHTRWKEGKSSDWLHSVEFQRLLRYFLSVCRTMSYAHDMGVVHCDLKPQNIKIGKYDEAFVLDWGEATSYGSRLDVPRHHSGRISPAYAPPELASGDAPPTPGSDIFSLGVILYELLVGRRAADDSPNERLEHLKSTKIPRALASICIKGLEAQRQARYESVRDMADDIERFLADDHVSVHKYSVGERVARSLRRYTTVTQIGGIVITTLLVIAALLGLRLKVQNAQQRETQIKTLMVSAGLSADSIAGEIDRRVMFLEGVARQIGTAPELNESFVVDEEAGTEQNLGDSNLMAWLNERLNESDVPYASSWFVLNPDGKQIAKQVDPADDRVKALSSLGKNYAYRDYFHGQGIDFAKEDVASRTPEMVERPYLCRRYTSSTTGDLRVALTVPIRDTDGVQVGVLGMSFNIDRLSFVSHRLNEEESLILVDTRKAANGEAPGTIVVHPGYRSKVLNGYTFQYRRVSETELSKLVAVQSRRKVQYENIGTDQRLPDVDNYLGTFSDPVSDSNRPIGAAFEPILIRHHGSLIETGLVVMVRGQRS